MKKAIILITFIAALCCPVFAEGGIPDLSDSLFTDAKDALTAFEAADYAAASEVLGFADANELGKFASGNYFTFGSGVQTDIAVAWWNGSAWNLAVPLYEPSDPMTETLVLITNINDGAEFSGYMFAFWNEVEVWLSESDYVIWNEEYTGTTSFVVFEDN